jgi:plasmid stabilization system protein ParE
MKRRRVVLLDSAEADLTEIGIWLVEVASREVATRYIGRVWRRIQSLEYGSERGSIRNEVSDLRLIGIMPSVSVAFVVDDDEVAVHRVLYHGRRWDDDENED